MLLSKRITVQPGEPVDRERSASSGLVSLELIETPIRLYRPRQWDEFAWRCGASFMSAWSVVRLARLTNRIVVIEIFIIDGTHSHKIGQCALVVKRREVKFIDRLMLLPEYRSEWAACVSAIVERFGPRAYRYGSHWNEEEPCDVPVPQSYSVEQKWSRDFHVDAVDLSQWTDFDHYLESISNNVRRDLAKAACEIRVAVRTRCGWPAVLDISALTAVRRHVMQKNHKPFSAILDAFVHLGKIAVFGSRACVVTASHNSKKLAALFCIEFGDCLYYVSGGVLPNDVGLGSLIMIKTIERWHADHPRGRFVMGYAKGQNSPEEYTGGALLYRRKLRVRSRHGVEFTIKFSRDDLG
jgi:hypothetical protein